MSKGPGEEKEREERSVAKLLKRETVYLETVLRTLDDCR